MSNSELPPEARLGERILHPASRRSFLRWSGVAALAAGTAGAVACDDDDPMDPMNPDPDPDPDPPDPTVVTLDFSNDFGVLNYAYALEQLEAAFYAAVLMSPFDGVSAEEEQVLTDLRDHEVAHREFYAAALGDNAIGGLTPNFDAVDFASRDSVLQTAMTFEDLGVAAYNGAGKFLEDPGFLTQAGKIVSVEARHASIIRTLLEEDFAPDSFDAAMAPADVVQAAQAFIEETINVQNA